MTIAMQQTSFFRRVALFAFMALFVFGGFVVGTQKVSAATTTAECTAEGGQCFRTTSLPSPTFYQDIGTCDRILVNGDNHCMKARPQCLGADVACQATCGAAGADPRGLVCGGGLTCCKVVAPTCTGTGKTCTLTTCASGTTRDTTGLTCSNRSAICCVPDATTGTACTALTPTAGVCKTGCASTDHSASGTCSTGTTCCVPNATTGTACTALTPTAGVCKTGCASTDHSASGTCSTGTTCCVPNGSTTGGGGSTTTSFTNPLQYNTVQDVLGSLLTTLQGIIVILSIVFIIIGALLYITSGGSESQIKTAKSAITAAMIGLAIGIATPSFLKEISTILGWNSVPANVSSAVSLTTILTNVLNFLLGITGILAIIMLIVGAIMFLSSAGDENRLDAGKKIVKASIIGIIVTFAALLIVKQIAALFVV